MTAMSAKSLAEFELLVESLAKEVDKMTTALEKMITRETPDKKHGIVDTIEAIASMVDELSNLPGEPPSIYVDLEGVNLGRHGTISILQIHVRSTSQNYLVDVKTLGEAAFLTPGTLHHVTLKDILEDSSIPKVFYDVRNDSDALYSHYRVDLRGIRDLQLMEYATRRPQRGFLCGLKRCIEMDIPMTTSERLKWLVAKRNGLRLFAPERGGSYEVFNQRPLPEEIRVYCVQDVEYLPRLWDLYDRKLTAVWRTRVQEAEDARVLESQRKDFNGDGRHMAEPPKGWGTRVKRY